MTPQYIKAHFAPSVVERGLVELKIVRKTAQALLKAGYSISVHDGEEVTLSKSQSFKEIMRAVMTTDEDCFFVYKNGSRDSFIYFVYGNDGLDVISDYGVSLESVLKPVLDYAESLA
ncbi:MAG: hypothetical protein KGI54_14585 [Pseudomonadota bacterium]|nr:hypothetical protein [Pseudomonadota bacterium]